jgi:hypothetical protein
LKIEVIAKLSELPHPFDPELGIAVRIISLRVTACCLLNQYLTDVRRSLLKHFWIVLQLPRLYEDFISNDNMMYKNPT